jgi:ABC-type antimicrobial peptide transport system permease subunit
LWTKELRRHKGRTVATAVAVASAMALLVSMLSISEGIIASVESSIRDSSADLLVGAPYDANFAAGHAIAANLSSWPEIEFASPALRSLVSVVSVGPGAATYSAVALGVVPGQFRQVLPAADQALVTGWFADEGDPFFANNYTGTFTGEVVLSTQLAESLGVGQNDTVNVTSDPGTPTIPFRVVGTIPTQLSAEKVIQEVRWAFFHLAELQWISGAAFAKGEPNGTVADEVNKIYVSLDPSARLEPDGAHRVQQAIEGAYPDFAGMVTTKSDRLARIQNEYAVGRIFYTAIGSVSLAIGLLFVACVVVISVSERTRDIGALRAIGISRRSIFIMILGESVVLVAFGAALGILPAYFGATALSGYVAATQGAAPTLVVFTPGLVGGAMARVLAFGALISLYPAWKATRVPVVEAMAGRG